LAQQYGLTQAVQQIQALIYVQQAINEAENGNVNQALTYLQNAQKLDPSLNLQPYFAYVNVVQLINNANQALQNNDYKSALNYLNQALQIAQQYPDVIDVTQIQQEIQVAQALQQIHQYVNDANNELENANFAQAYQYLQQAQQLAQKYNISAKGLDNATTAVSYLAKIPPFPKAPQGEITLQKVQQYLQALESYYATASQYATEASRYYSGFSALANRYQRTQQVASQLLSVVNLLVNAQDTVEKNTNSVSAVQNAINLVQQAQNQLKNVNADGTPLADLASSIAEVAQEMYVKYTALLQVLEDIKKGQQEAENGNYSEAVQYLQQAQQIAQQNGFDVDLTPYIQGFSILEGLQPLPQPPSTQTFLSLSQYFNQVYQVLQQNYQVLEKASKYLQVNLQAVQGDIQDAKNISQALGLLAEAQQLLNPPQSNTPNGNASNSNTISEILANKDKILSDISQALQLLSESQSYDMQDTAKQLFEIAQNFQTQVQTYLAGLEKTQQALDALNTVNQLVNQQVKANSPSAYFLALQNSYTEALRVLKNAMSFAMQANSLFEKINATPPFDMNQLQKEDIALEQSIQLFGTTANVYSAIENVLNNQNNLNTPSDYAKYYQNVASTIQSTIQKGIQEINSLNITDDGVNQVRQQIVQSLQQMQTDYLALSNAFNIIASASTWTTVKPARYGNRIAPGESAGGNSPQALAQAYQKASQYLSQYPDLQNIAQQFANLSQFYSLIAQADDLLQQAKASSSISNQISLMERAKASLQQALQYVSSDSQVYKQIQSEISNIDKAVSVLQNAQSIVQQLNNAINNGDYPSALVYYNKLLQVTQGININNVINDVATNNYFKAIEDVNNNPSLQPQQKQFLNSLIATIGINMYYLPLMQSSLQQAHLQASSWTQALSETFNFTAQMQPVVTNLQNAIQYAVDAQSLAQYVSPQVQQNLSQIVSKLQEQYNAIQEQIQKAQSNWALNAFEGFANVFNTGLNNMMNDINNFIYSRLGKNVWTEILAGIVDGAVFIAISAIPIVGQVFDVMATISFVGSTAFNLLAGPASFNETVNSFKQMFTSPTSLSMIGTLVAGALARRLIEPSNIETVNLVKTADSVKSALSKIEGSIKDRVGVSAISDKVINTIKSDVTKSPDFSKINNLVKEVSIEKLDIKALKNKDLGNTIVKVEGNALKFVKIDISGGKLTVETSYVFKNVKLKSFKGVGNIEVKISKDLTKGTKVNIKPEPINQPTVTLENGNLHFTGEISEKTIKNLLSSNDFATAFAKAQEMIKLNLASVIAKQLLEDLQKADGNIVKISPDEGIAYIGDKFYDVLYKDGNIVKMEAIDPLMAQAKLTKFAEDNAGNFVTQNSDLIKQLLEKNKNLQSIEYYLSNKFAGNVVRNEYLKLKDALGKELELTSKTRINPGEIETTNTIEGNIPSELAKSIAQKEISYLTPQEVNEILSFDNRISRIFRPLIDEHPEVKDLLEKLASQRKLPNDIGQLEEIAGKIKSFYEALDEKVKGIENQLSNKPQLSKLFDGVNLSSVVDKIADKIVKERILNNPDAVLKGEVPEITLSDVIDHLSMSSKAKVVLNYLKADPKVYNEVMEKLKNFSPEARDYILAQAFDQIAIAIKNNLPITPKGLETVVQDIDNAIETIKNKGPQGSKAPVSASPTSTASSGTTPTSSTEGTASNVSSNGTATVLQSSAQQSVQQGAETHFQLFSTFNNVIQSMFPDFDKLPSGVKLLFWNIVERLIQEKGEVSTGDLQNALKDAIEKYQTQLRAIFDSLKKMADNVKAETTSSSEEETVLNSLDKGIGELEKKVGFDLQRLSYLLSIASFVADRYNVATALEFLNQLNSLTPQQLQNAVILTQPQIETITNITPLLKELIVKLNQGVETKDVLDIATQIREALEKMGVNLDAEQLIRVINALQTLTQQLKLKVSDIAILIAVNDLNGLLAIPVPIISNINSLIASTQLENSTITGNSLSVGTEEIPETTLAVGDIPLQGTTLEQLQQLLQPPPVTPPNATVEGNQGGRGINLPPSYSTPQFASYSSKQQYLII